MSQRPYALGVDGRGPGGPEVGTEPSYWSRPCTCGEAVSHGRLVAVADPYCPVLRLPGLCRSAGASP